MPLESGWHDALATLSTAQLITGLKTFSPSATSAVGLIVKGLAAQTGNLVEFHDSAAVVIGRVTSDGRVHTNANFCVGATLYAANATKLGITATGAAEIVSIFRGTTSQTGDLTQWMNIGGTVMAKVNAAGELQAPVVTSLTNTGPYINMTATAALVINRTTASNVVLVARGMAGQTGNLQEWQDSAGVVLTRVNSSGSVFAPFVSAGGAYAGGYLSVVAASAGSLGVLIRGAASQTANLTEWQNSAGTVLAKVTGTGLLTVNADVAFGTSTNLSATTVSILARNAGDKATVIRGAASQTASLTEWQNSAGTVLAQVTAAGTVVGITVAGTSSVTSPTVQNLTSTGPYLSLTATGLEIINRTTATNVVLVVRGMAAQTGDLQQWRDSAGTVLRSVTAAGLMKWSDAASVQLTVGAAGAASALPATPSKYLKIVGDDGTTYVIPAYAA